MDYFINGKYVNITAGQGIFINSKRLHYNFSSTQTNSKYLVITINPLVLGESMHPVKSFMNEKFSDSSEDFMILTVKETWHEELIQRFHTIYREFVGPQCNLLHIISLATEVCSVICDYIQPALNNQGNEAQWMTIWKMTGFIHKNYEDKILIDDIATAASICRSKCYELFNDYVKQTPLDYLTNYRIQKSCEMLRDTDASVCEIAMACGFQSASYFSQVFREETGLTPRKYRLETK